MVPASPQDPARLLLALLVPATIALVILAVTGQGWGFAFFGLFPVVYHAGRSPRRVRGDRGRSLPAPPSPEPEDWTPPRTRDDEVDGVAVPAAPTPPAPVAPSAHRPPASPELPGSVRELAAEAREVAARLAARGRGRLADAIEEALAEVTRLARVREELGEVGAAIAAARAEAATLDARASGCEDADAREAWARSAQLARGRAARLAELQTVHERADARIEGFRQIVKSAALDAARLGLGETPETSLGDLARSAQAVELEADALHRTVEELRRLQTAARAGAP